MKLLDCTFRDGGYYNGWDFPENVLQDYLSAMDQAGIDFLELGYRSFTESSTFEGRFKFISDKFLESLPKLNHSKFAVMIDVKELAIPDIENLLNKKFQQKEKSRLSMVRLAATVENIEIAIKAAIILKKLGYEVSINVMQYTSINSSDLENLIRIVSSSAIEILYFADSFGNAIPSEIDSIFKILKKFPQMKFGFHFHNNLSLALANAIKAIENNCEFIDATILGMGRGAGNLETESFVALLNKKLDIKKYNLSPLLSLCNSHFIKLKNEYKWGPDINYVMSGYNNIHPKYVQELSSNKRYNAEEISSIIRFLENSKASSFSKDVYNEAILHRFDNTGKFVEYTHINIDDFKIAHNRNILIVGRGPSSKDKCQDINQLIKKSDYIVIECNEIPEIISVSDMHFCAFVKYSNFAESCINLSPKGKKAIIGFPKIGSEIKEVVNKIKPIYAKYFNVKNEFNVEKDINIPYDVISMYAIAIALKFKAKSIHLVGFDGYDDRKSYQDAVLQLEMEEFFSLIKNNYSNSLPISLTKTSYKIPTKSLFYLLDN